ncbi:hypothetical protein F5890DRAFT_1552125 [Lentinula detonsa]|uniref:Uncharacterized protein n=1 Tax=Lentinula detonsa TaxID=2804962 RepID=A0AA38Q3W8_9AGAR|nr:hypothetical protein F5890DRAFT_1552125 [Lentinula detonsa]
MQFQLSAVFFFSHIIMLVAASPIPIASSVVARLPEPVDSPLAPMDVEARALEFIADSPLAPLDAEARGLSESTANVDPPLDVEFRTLEARF